MSGDWKYLEAPIKIPLSECGWANGLSKKEVRKRIEAFNRGDTKGILSSGWLKRLANIICKNRGVQR